MPNPRRLSAEEIKQISLRMKSARTLTGLNQEEFSKKYQIPLMSLKGWEMGRAIPRKDGLNLYLDAVKQNGIEVDFDWIFYGSGHGPTYLNGTQIEKPKAASSYLESLIELFKKEQLAKGFNPIICEVKDSEMLPHFAIGDIVGGIFTTIDDIKNIYSYNEITNNFWLINIEDNNYAPRFLRTNSSSTFYNSGADLSIKPYLFSSIGKICFYYKSSNVYQASIKLS